MPGEPLASYYAIALLGLAALAFAGAAIILSAMVGPRDPDPEKLDPYESGMWPIGDARGPFPVKFYLVAMMFMLFAIEAVFLFPWAAVLKERLRVYGLVEMGIFLAILVVGYVYIWRRGVFDWEKAEQPGPGLTDDQ
ncbi:MAG: NADH-quinone oxidoreductase subunit A [Armatimonadota bacterium]